MFVDLMFGIVSKSTQEWPRVSTLLCHLAKHNSLTSDWWLDWRLGRTTKSFQPLRVYLRGWRIPQVSSSAGNIDIIFDSYINLEKHVMNTCLYSHKENSKNTELFLSRRGWDTCSSFYFIQAGFLQSTSIWVTTSGSRKVKVCTKLGCSPRVQNSKLLTYNTGTSSTAVATNQATSRVQDNI